MTLAVNVQQGVQFHQTGGLDPQIVLKGERLSYFLLGCGLLLVKVLQLGGKGPAGEPLPAAGRSQGGSRKAVPL